MAAVDECGTIDIQESLQRLLQHQAAVADLFYEIFLDRYPEARPYFQGVNLRQQAILLTMALTVIEGYYSHSFPSMAMYLKYLGTKHHGRGVPAELYPSFCDALLSALEQFHGPDWNPRLAGQWQEAIRRASQAMLEGYRERFTV